MIDFYAEIRHETWVNDYAIDTGERSTLTPEQTSQVLDSLGLETLQEIRDEGPDSGSGDSIAYGAEKAGWWEGPEGPFTVLLMHADEALGTLGHFDREEAMDAYLADREARGIPSHGDDSAVQDSGTRDKIEQINILIASLPEDARRNLIDTLAPRPTA